MCWKWKKFHSLKKILKLFIEFLLSENKIRYKVAFFLLFMLLFGGRIEDFVFFTVSCTFCCIFVF